MMGAGGVIMQVQTITVEDFVVGWEKVENARFECLQCGFTAYYIDPFDVDSDAIDGIFVALPDWVPEICCRRCDGDAVRVSDSMSEIAALFTQCGYAVMCAETEVHRRHVSRGRESEKLRVCVLFREAYPAEMFQDLPVGFDYTHVRADGVTMGDLTYEYSDYDLLAKFEKELVLDDALSALYAWVSDLHSSKAYLVYALAGLI